MLSVLSSLLDERLDSRLRYLGHVLDTRGGFAGGIIVTMSAPRLPTSTRTRQRNGSMLGS